MKFGTMGLCSNEGQNNAYTVNFTVQLTKSLQPVPNRTIEL